MASKRGSVGEGLYSNSSQNRIRVSEKGNSLLLSSIVSFPAVGFETLDDCSEPEVERRVLSLFFASAAGLASESELELTSGFDLVDLAFLGLTIESG